MRPPLPTTTAGILLTGHRLSRGVLLLLLLPTHSQHTPGRMPPHTAGISPPTGDPPTTVSEPLTARILPTEGTLSQGILPRRDGARSLPTAGTQQHPGAGASPGAGRRCLPYSTPSERIPLSPYGLPQGWPALCIPRELQNTAGQDGTPPTPPHPRGQGIPPAWAG